MLHRRVRQAVDQRGGVARFGKRPAPLAAAVGVVIVIVVGGGGGGAVGAVVAFGRTDG